MKPFLTNQQKGIMLGIGFGMFFSGAFIFNSRAMAMDACKDDVKNFLAIPSQGLTAPLQIKAEAGTEIIKAYIKDQLTAYGLTSAQFSAMTIEQQRLVLMPGHRLALSRETLHMLVPKRINVPEEIMAQLKVNETISAEKLSRYAIILPESLRLSLPDALQTYQTVIIGDEAIFLDVKNNIKAVLPEIYPHVL